MASRFLTYRSIRMAKFYLSGTMARGKPYLLVSVGTEH